MNQRFVLGTCNLFVKFKTELGLNVGRRLFATESQPFRRRKEAKRSDNYERNSSVDTRPKTHDNLPSDVISRVNGQVEDGSHGRLFAVVRIFGKQFKVTAEDIVVLQNHFVPPCGERIRLDKVLLVGGADFTLLGRPLLNKDLVRVDATVMEKTLSHLITRFHFKPRQRYRKIHFRRVPFTMLRINSIAITGPIDQVKTIEGLQDRIV